jgi:Kef-type K+ transport system membrane component KefB
MTHSPLLLQLVLILGTARILSLVLRRLGQPPVIGEMAAGIVLGPMVLGAMFPAWHSRVFEPSSLPALEGLSQLGLVLFMFIVGAEMRAPHGARRQVIAAAWVGLASVIVPMAFGIAAAALLYGRFAPAGVPFLPFALFMSSAMSITAFPIMARILKERGMTHSVIGRLSLASAAMADVLAWIMLALVVVLIDARDDWRRFGEMLAGLVALASLLLVVGRPLLARMVVRFTRDGRPEGPILAALLIGTFACAYATSTLGLHPVFGAFLFGATLPRDDRLLEALIERVEHVAIIVLMPVFFALAGLNTTPSVFAGAGLAAMSIVLVGAVAGKMIGGAVGARIAGYRWRTAFAVGSLMNARALMELIVMKVGLDAGVIGADMFTMLMVMAILTTFMTGPLLTFFSSGNADQEPVAAETTARP